ncbi:MAG: helix-turn-helix transcriptional regulator [Rikenellaceae bacterium]
MNKIFRETVGINFPTISRKTFRERECREQLLAEKNIIGYIISGQKQINGGKFLNAGDLFYMTIDNFNIVYKADPNTSVYEEISVCFTINEIRETIMNIITYDDVKEYILARKNVFVGEWVSDISTERLRIVFDSLIHSSNLENYDGPLCNALDKIKVTELLFTILTDVNLNIGAAIVKLVKCNHDKLRLTVTESAGKKSSINEIAEKCSMSPSQFKKLFGQIYGTSPHKYLANQQLEKAAFLLKNTDKPIGDIARECEFSNASHLIKRFKDNYNITPSGYRKSFFNMYSE